MSTASKAMAAVTVGFFSMLVNLSALVFVPLLVVEVNGLSDSRTRAAGQRQSEQTKQTIKKGNPP